MDNHKIKLRQPDVVFQHETGECGLACISMFTDALGAAVELSELRARFPVTSAGASLMELTEILAQQNVPALPVKFNVNKIENLPLPAILHFGGNHYVFVSERKGRYIRVYNPASGMVISHLDTLLEHFTGYAVILDRTHYLSRCAQQKGQKKEKNNRKHHRRFLARLKVPYLKRIFIGSLAIGGLAFLIPLLYSQVLDRGSFPEYLGTYSPFIIVCFAVCLSALTEIGVAKLAIKQRGRLSSHYIPGLFSLLMQKRMSYFEQRQASDTNQRLSSLSRVIVQYGALHNTLAISFLTTLLATFFMCWLHPLLGVLALSVILFYGVISSLYGQPRDALQHAAENAASERNEFTYETINNIGLIKSASMFGERCAKFTYKNEKVINCASQLQWLNVKQQLSYQLLANIENIIMLAVAMYLFSVQALSVGELFAFVMCKQIALGAATDFYMGLIARREQKVVERRAQEIIAPPEAVSKVLRSDFVQLSCKQVSFGYNATSPVFQFERIRLMAGEKIALIGVSGSGKSSLMKMLCGWLTPQEGQLILDGVPRDWAAMQQLAFYQRPEDTLLSGSVLDNITLFGPPEKAGPAIRLADALGLTACIDALPHRYYSHVSHSNPLLSAGQQQRLMVARALCSDKPLLLLDEPTANLDKANSLLTINTIIESDKTVIVALHDHSLLSCFDRVIEINGGALRILPGHDYYSGKTVA
jgi:ABC-type bacteriocin/lantibiotic exporter with double-glycine peptidase domain